MSTRDNGLKPLLVSKLLTDVVSVNGHERRLVRCPACLRWAGVSRHLIDAHRGEDEVARCEAGSRRRLLFDLDPADWAARLAGVSADVACRRATPTRRKPVPPVPVPVHRIAAA